METFDSPQAEARFGVSFDKLTNNIQCAQLFIPDETHLQRGPTYGQRPISLGSQITRPAPRRRPGLITSEVENPSPGLITNVWCNQLGCGQLFPWIFLICRRGVNLLPIINSTHRLDILSRTQRRLTTDIVLLLLSVASIVAGTGMESRQRGLLQRCGDEVVISSGGVITNISLQLSAGRCGEHN